MSTLDKVLFEIGNNTVLSVAQNEDFAVLVPKQFYNISFFVEKSILKFKVFINYELNIKETLPNPYIDPFTILPFLSVEIGRGIKSTLFNLEPSEELVDLPEEMKIKIEYNEFSGSSIVVSSTVSKFIDLYKKAFMDELSLRQLEPIGMSMLDLEENEE